ncbi:MAG: recombinase family protein [Lachnospiraceae bacterium]|nr:recombinase family protein [Lachnospiraceae bacterium]
MDNLPSMLLNASRRMMQSEGYYSVHDEKYGYLLTEDRRGFVVDEEVAPVIREIFYLAAEKELPYTEIAKILNQKGYETPMMHLARVSHKKRTVEATEWVASSVKRVADNTAYIGYWYKMIDGVRMKVEIEPLVGQEAYRSRV